MESRNIIFKSLFSLCLLWCSSAVFSEVPASHEILVDAGAYREYPNLLHNRSFEAHPHANRSALATLWSCRKGAIRNTESDARSGQCTLSISGEGSANQNLDLLPDTEYVFRVFWRGTGDGLKLLAMADRRTLLGEIEAKGASSDWSELLLRFSTPQKLKQCALTIEGKMATDQTVWVDDPSLHPLDGELPVAPVPTMTPLGGTFDGPSYVTFQTDLAGADVRVTLDGTEPCAFSLSADVPIRIANSCRLRAKVFHDAYRESPAVEAPFVIRPTVPANGVPHFPFRIGQPVEDWWKEHVYNPESVNYIEHVDSPEPRVNVADVRDANPDSQTAGIEEALAQLPPAGGTLWFPKQRGPYILAKDPVDFREIYKNKTQIAVLDRSNVHLISDGAEIRGRGPTLFTVSSTEHTRTGVMQNPVGNWLVRGLHFDGQGTSDAAFEFYHVFGVLFENCSFRGFTALGSPNEDQILLARSQTDNFWIRHCDFESGTVGVLADGVFDGGVLDSHFGPGMTRTHISGFRNSDMFIPQAMVSPLARHNRYFVVANNRFEGGEKGPAPHAVAMCATETLVTGNTGKNLGVFVSWKGTGLVPHNWPHRYATGGILVRDNTLKNVRFFSETRRRLDFDHLNRGHIFENNKGTVTQAILNITDLKVDRQGAAGYVHGFTYRDNNFTGTKVDIRFDSPQARDQLINLKGLDGE